MLTVCCRGHGRDFLACIQNMRFLAVRMELLSTHRVELCTLFPSYPLSSPSLLLGITMFWYHVVNHVALSPKPPHIHSTRLNSTSSCSRILTKARMESD